MTPCKRIEAGALLIPVGAIFKGQIVVVCAHRRYRQARIIQHGDRFVRVAFKITPTAVDVERCYARHNIYKEAPALSLRELARLDGVRVYETVTNLAYDKTRKGPHRVVKLQSI